MRADEQQTDLMREARRMDGDRSSQSIGAFAEALGSSAPTPGGGAASALVGALAAALAEMVARFTVGRARYRDVETQASEIIQQAEQARVEFVSLVQADEKAFGVVSSAYQLPKSSDEERRARDAEIQAALRTAMQPPLQAMRASLRVVTLARDIAQIGNTTVLSDAACAATIGEAAARAAALNVLANVALLHDTDVAHEALRESRATCAEALILRDVTLAIVYRRMDVEGL
jgi:formiminotetrahydrofolate cyclodeaminase